jgi:hypothetical protein
MPVTQGGGGCVGVLVRCLLAPLRGIAEVTQTLHVARLSPWGEEDEAAQLGSEQGVI